MTQNPQRNIAKLARMRVLVVNYSKNPAHEGAQSSAKSSKVGGEAGSCCNHSKQQEPGEGEGSGAMLCTFLEELPFGRRVADKRPFLFPHSGGAAPARGPAPSGGAAAAAAEDPRAYLFPSK